MLDFIKLTVSNQQIINRVFLHPDFVNCTPPTNYYYSKYHKEVNKSLQFNFNKIPNTENFHHVDICISPHYHSNKYLHNGNDLTPENCINSIKNILTYLQVEPHEYNELKVVNLEFGLNIIPEKDIKEIINGLIYSKKTPFKVYDTQNKPYFKESERQNSRFKEIKAYAKGLQFQELPQYGIDINTFRFEIRAKKHRKIKSLGITTAENLINIEIYPRLAEEIINEWQNVLLINFTPDFRALKPDEVHFIKQAQKIDFWNDLITNKSRNTFVDNKIKYYKILKEKNNLHHLIKLQIIDKCYQLLNCANSPQETTINKEILKPKENALNTINCEYAQNQTIKRYCKETHLDISIQKKGSIYLCNSGLLWYYENDIKTFTELQRKYLSEDKKKLPLKKQIYYIAHNIRNQSTNLKHNRNRFIERNYSTNQLQFNF